MRAFIGIAAGVVLACALAAGCNGGGGSTLLNQEAQGRAHIADTFNGCKYQNTTPACSFNSAACAVPGHQCPSGDPCHPNLGVILCK